MIIVLGAGNSISSKEKLEYLNGAAYREIRKQIIREMIEKEKIHPDQLISEWQNPLLESISSNDVEFARYLLEQGITIDDDSLVRFPNTISREMAEILGEPYDLFD